MIKFYKKFEEQSEISKKAFVNFKANFWKHSLTDSENVMIWWNFNGNLWKFYKRENCKEMLGKL